VKSFYWMLIGYGILIGLALLNRSMYAVSQL
jgi:hypothetical protein